MAGIFDVFENHFGSERNSSSASRDALVDALLGRNQYAMKATAWSRATPSGFGEAFGIRLDAWGTEIRYQDYGKRDSEYGWEIDHIIPKSLGGNDEISNLQPLHWRNNLAKADSSPLRGLFS